MKEHFIYILLCGQETFYVGITDNIKRRMMEHKNKQSFFTKKFSEVRPVYFERYDSKSDAVKREKQLKGWSHAKKILLLEGGLGINRIEVEEVL